MVKRNLITATPLSLHHDVFLAEALFQIAHERGVQVAGRADELAGVDQTDADVIACGTEILLYTTLTYFLCGIMDLIPGALRGMGHSAVPMILSIIGTVGTRIFWIYGVFPTHRSLMVLFLSYPASWLATILLQAICFYFVRKKVHSTMPQEEPL